MKRRELELSPQERAELEQMRAHDRRAYMREKAAALLKIADGVPAYQVAESGLLRRRRQETVYGWLNEYETHRNVQAHKPRRRSFSP